MDQAYTPTPVPTGTPPSRATTTRNLPPSGPTRPHVFTPGERMDTDSDLGQGNHCYRDEVPDGQSIQAHTSIQHPDPYIFKSWEACR